MRAVQSRFVELDGIQTHYLEAGTENLETILLIHGGGASSCAELNYGKVIDLLARDLHVVALDVVGFGRTSAPSTDYYPSSAQGDFILRFIEQMNLTVHIAGNSHGGWLANYVAHENPNRVKSVIVINSRGASLTPDDPYYVWDADIGGYRPPRRPWNISKAHPTGVPNREAVRQKLLKGLENKNLVTDDLVDRTMEILHLNGETAAARWRYNASNEDDYRNDQMYRGKYMCEQANALRLPVLLTWSRENPGSTPTQALHYLNQLVDGQMHVFTNARHHVMAEKSREWSQVVRQFVLRNTSG